MLRATLLASALAMAAAVAIAGEFGDDVHYYKSTDPTQQALNELVGKDMPTLSVAGWINGEVKPDALKGKVVIVDVWATWCPPCLAAIPHNNKLLEKHGKDGLVIIGVCSSRGQEKLDSVVTGRKIAYPVCKDPENKTAETYKVRFYPTYVLIDRKGKVRAIGVKPNAVGPIVEKLLAEKE